MKEYKEISQSEVPSTVRFDVPGSLGGQIVEVAYGGFRRSEHDHGDPYMRVTDQSAGKVKFFRLKKA
jgi:hypothetical protein